MDQHGTKKYRMGDLEKKLQGAKSVKKLMGAIYNFVGSIYVLIREVIFFSKMSYLSL